MPDINDINGVAVGSINDINGVLKANIADINGLTIPSAAVGTPVAAYSVRLLGSAVGISSYTGDCMRVRRASDSVEADVGFDTNDELSLTSPISNTSDAQSYTDLADFVDHTGTPTDAYVRYWYDQASSNDAGQSTSTKQPQIYNGTAVITKNSKPAVLGAIGGDHLDANGVINTSIRSIYAFSVFTLGAGSWQSITGNSLIQTHASASQNFRIATVRATSTAANATVQNTLGQTYLAYAYADTSRLRAYRDGSASALIDVADTNADWNSSDMSIFANGSTGELYLSELILYQTDISSNRTGIESDINGYFSIYT